MGKIKSLVAKLPKWKTPQPGKSLTMKDWLIYCVGGMGAMGATIFTSLVTLQHGIYIAAAIGMSVDHITIISIVTSIVVIVTSPLVSYLIDNTNSKYGKFRPYLIWLPIPMVLCFFALGQIAAAIPNNYVAMVILFTILFNILNFLNRLYTLAFNSIVQVISPSVDERTQLMSIGTFFTSLGPTLVSMLFPMIANYVYQNDKISGVNQIGAFKWILPIMALVFFLIGLWFAFSVKERIVVSKSFKQKVKFFDGVKRTLDNRYFWILNLSNMFGVLRMLGTTFTVWIILYLIFPELKAQGMDDMANFAQTIITTLIGDACVPGMLLAPIFIKKFGKKKMLLISNIGSALATLPMLFVTNPYVLLVCIYLITLFNGLCVVLMPAFQAEVYDYQQFKTGDRLEGFLSQFGVILTTLIGIPVAFITPAVYKHFGYVDDTSVLYNKDVIIPIIRTMCAIGLASGILSVIPYFFYNLSAKTHSEIMNVLKMRQYRDDGIATDDECSSIEADIMNGNLDSLEAFEVAHDLGDMAIDAKTIEKKDDKSSDDNDSLDNDANISSSNDEIIEDTEHQSEVILDEKEPQSEELVEDNAPSSKEE